MKTLIAFLLLCSQCYGINYIQTHHERIPAIGSDATLNAPTADANESFRISSGQTVVITGTQSCKDIYVNGAGDADAVLELADGCELRFQTIVLFGQRAILRGDVSRCKLVIRDLPFDLVNDPQQFGNGIICISGQVLLNGAGTRDVSTLCMGHLRSGASIIHFDSTPSSWKVGDRLFIPDTRQRVANDNTNQTESATIASVTNNSVTLAAPLQFDHRHYEYGTIAEFFSIANVSQPIVIESENPNGIRGHIIFLDHCKIEISGVEFRELGRTTTAPLHNSLIRADGTQQIGTNQIGRYAIHLHGMPGRPDRQPIMRYFSIVGCPKLGLVLHHASHYGLYEHFALVDIAGGALTTETPNVYGNRFFDGIIIGKRAGSGLRITARNHRNQAGGDHWHCTTGLALQSAMNEFDSIDIYAVQEGIGLAGFRTSILYKPLRRGEHETSTNRQNLTANPYRYPFLPSPNVRVWNAVRGIETWTADSYANTERMFPGLELIHTLSPTDLEDQQETYIDSYRILGDFTQIRIPSSTMYPRTYGLFFKPGYRFGITVNGGYIGGYDAAYNLIHDQQYTRFIGTTFECPVINYLPTGFFQRGAGVTWDGLWEDCEFIPVNRVCRFIDGLPSVPQVFQVGRPDICTLNRVSYAIRPWRDGRDLDVYHPEQHPTFELKPILPTQAYGDWPLGLNTHQQLIDRNLAIYGAVVPETATQDAAQFGTFYIDDVTTQLIKERLDRIEQILGIP